MAVAEEEQAHDEGNIPGRKNRSYQVPTLGAQCLVLGAHGNDEQQIGPQA